LLLVQLESVVQVEIEVSLRSLATEVTLWLLAVEVSLCLLGVEVSLWSLWSLGVEVSLSSLGFALIVPPTESSAITPMASGLA
jgi:hypothetical protein